MKTYGLTNNKTGTEHLLRAGSINEAKRLLCISEPITQADIGAIRIIPTARQVAKTKNLLRSL